ncbi:hypothetical protein ACTGJ9_025935 [Bradyrhizobium sp. RDM12]
MIHIPPADQAFLLLLIVSCLGTCLKRAIWELEQVRGQPDGITAPRTRNEA